MFGAGDVTATAEELAGAGVTFVMPPARQEWGASMGLFADPDGNVFVLHDV